MFIPVVRGVDVTTCGWPVVIGFMYANVVLRGAGVCCAGGFAIVGLKFCSWPVVMGFPAWTIVLRVSGYGCVLSLLVVSCETTLLNVVCGARCFAYAVDVIVGLRFCD